MTRNMTTTVGKTKHSQYTLDNDNIFEKPNDDKRCIEPGAGHTS